MSHVVTVLLHPFYLTWPPGLVDPRLKWPIHTQNCKPAFARNRPQPVDLFTFARFRGEIDVVGTIRIFLEPFALATDRGKGLAGNEVLTNSLVYLSSTKNFCYRRTGS